MANLFLGGLTLGWMLHLDHWPWQSSYVTEFGSQTGRAIEHLVRNLDSADRDMVVDTIRSHRDELSTIRQGHARAARQGEDAAARAGLRSPAAEEALAEMRRLADDMQAALGKAILEAVEKLPPEARRTWPIEQGQGPASLSYLPPSSSSWPGEVPAMVIARGCTF